jgi:hypothetical protein
MALISNWLELRPLNKSGPKRRREQARSQKYDAGEDRGRDDDALIASQLGSP